jgi:hypothetical protein
MVITRFWKSWSTGTKILLMALCITWLAGLVFMATGFVKGPSSVINWEVHYAQHTTVAEVAAFESGGFQFIVPADVYLTYGYYQGSAVKPPVTAANIFALLFILTVVTLLTLITTLPRFWFLTGTALFIVLFVSLRLEVLYLFSIPGRTIPIIILLGFVLLAFLFNVLRPDFSFIKRWLAFGCYTAVIAVMVMFFSGVAYPGYHLAVTAYWPALLLTLVFVTLIAHEIPAAFVYLSSQAGAHAKNALHFAIPALLYLVFLFLLYFDEARIYALNLPKFWVYLLLLLSAILGIWGTQQREHLYQNIFPFSPTGALLYITFAATAFFTIGYLLNAYNDAAIQVVREWVLFCFIGYGIIFFTYVVSNFMVMMAQNLPAYKVLYKPTRMPYVTFRLAGFIATLAFVFYMNWKEYVYHAMAGYYNNLADLHQQLGKQAFAEAFYQQVKSYAFQNNRANYQLGVLQARHYNQQEAAHLFELANARRPTPYSYVNAGNLYARTGTWFEAIRQYRRGFEKFKDPRLALNLGYAYAQVHKTDSAVYFIEQARKYPQAKALAESNFLALLGQEYIPLNVDSVAATLAPSDVLKANTLALAAQRRQYAASAVPDTSILFSNRVMDIPEATLLHNYLISSLGRTDTILLRRAITAATDSVNENFSEALKAALAYAQYYRLNVSAALALLSEVSFTSITHEGRYQHLLGLWLTEQGAAEQAIYHFERAAQAGYPDAAPYLAIARAQAGYHEQALQEATRLLQQPDSTSKQVARQLSAILTAHPNQLENDNLRYLFCLYRVRVHDATLFENILQRITDVHYRALALIDMSRKQLIAGNLSQALYYAGQLTNLPVNHAAVAEKIAHHELLIHALTGDLQGLRQKLEESPPFKGFNLQYLMLYQAMLAAADGNLAAASELFERLALQNPFFEEGVLAAARFFAQHGADDWAAYNLLADAIQRNRYSYRLLNAYAAEAARLGLDQYAVSARARAAEIRNRM